MLNVLYILEALRHNNIKPALLPGWTRENIEQQPNFYFRLRIKMLNVLYILEALRNKNIIKKDIEQQPNVFFGYGLKWLTCDIS